MFKKLNVFFMFFAVLIFVVSCSDNKKKDKDDMQITDSDEVSDEESDETLTDEESDATPDETGDDTADEDELNDEDSIQISGGVIGTLLVESGSKENIEVSLVECGNDSSVATSKTDSSGNFEIEYVLEKSKTYCVESNDFFSCFTAQDDVHKAEINPLTHLAFMKMESIGGCAKLRDAEKAVRTYMKLGTGIWLGELEYSDLSGIQQGFESVRGITEKSKMADILGIVLIDSAKSGNREFEEFFNGFSITAGADEVIIENSTTPVDLFISGKSVETTPGFSIKWFVIGETDEGAKSDIWTDNSGEYIVRSELFISGSDTAIAEAFSTVTFFKVQAEGVIDISDLSADISFWFNDDAVAIFAAGTEVKRNGGKVSEIEYKILSSGESSKIAKVAFSPSGTVFLNDPMFLMINLNSVFSGDPIMLGVERVDSGGTMSVLNQASGDPIMLTASGDPIMFTASGDPIMNIASGDPIMSGNMSNVLVTSTSHFSDFSVTKRSIPVNTSELLDRWQSDYDSDESPLKFIYNAIELYKGAGAADMKKHFMDRNSIAGIEGDVDKLLNRELGNIRNINIFENLYYIDSLNNRFKLRKSWTGFEKYAAVYKGFDLWGIISDMYIKRMSFERSVTISDIFDNSIVPSTFARKDRSSLPDLKKLASEAVLKISPENVDSRYIVKRKEALELLKYVNASKGPSFGVLNGALLPNETVCMWLTGKSTAQCKLTPGTFSVNSEGKVSIDGTPVTTSHIETIFENMLSPIGEDVSAENKHALFRTLYLILTYAANFYESGPKMTLFLEGVKKLVVAMFDGIDQSSSAVKLVDRLDRSYNTVAVVDQKGKIEVPIFSSMWQLLEKVSVIVPSGQLTSIDSVSIKIRGFGFDVVNSGQIDKRPVYEISSDMGIKTFAIKNPEIASFNVDENGQYYSDLAALFEGKELDSFGDCYGDISVAVISTVEGAKHVRVKNYRVNIGSLSQAESVAGTINSKPETGNLAVYLFAENWSPMTVSNAGISIKPGNFVFKNNKDGILIKDLLPAVYVIEAFAEGYYPVKKSISLNGGDSQNVQIQMNAIIAGAEKGGIKVNFSKRLPGGDTESLSSADVIDVYVVDHNSVIVKEFKGFDGSKILAASDLNYGQYTIKASSPKFYTLVEPVILNQLLTEFWFTLETKNVCGNGMIEAGELCDNGGETGTLNKKCKDVVASPTYPENYVYCSYECSFDTASCF